MLAQLTVVVVVAVVVVVVGHVPGFPLLISALGYRLDGTAH